MTGEAVLVDRPQGLNTKEIRDWEAWAFTQADRIDPVISARYLESMKDPAS